ncbi:MAG: hypothetical protein GWQ05_16815 [Verrucomicrobiaceae bacterium]|nr:hypothetical protein [Verrucomicrobiaceae bacterium]
MRQLAVFLFFVVFASQWSISQTIALAWDASEDPLVAGYRVKFGTTSGVYLSLIDVGGETTATITNLSPDTGYYFVVFAYSEEELESLPSNEVYVVTDPDPDPDPDPFPASYRDWWESYFPFVDFDNPSMQAVVGLQANPDGDGWTNAFEFYLGLNPLACDEPEFHSSSNGDHFSVTFSKSIDAPTDWAALEYSICCHDWFRVVDADVQEIGPASNGRVPMEVTGSTPVSDQMFFRFVREIVTAP